MARCRQDVYILLRISTLHDLQIPDYVNDAKRHIYIYIRVVHETFLRVPNTDPNKSGTNQIKVTVRQLGAHNT